VAAGDDAEARLAEFVRNSYYCDLSISISWMRLGCSQIIRYEDLWRDPVAALERLTSRIRAVPAERIERAVDRCALEVLRGNAGKHQKFFRKGSVGDWQTELPPAIHSIFGEQSPYPEQLACLGYTMAASDPLMARPRLRRKSLNPFESITEFANGVPVPPLAAIVFLRSRPRERATGRRRGGRTPAPSSNGSFQRRNVPLLRMGCRASRTWQATSTTIGGTFNKRCPTREAAIE
jgi:hypothetical protein